MCIYLHTYIYIYICIYYTYYIYIYISSLLLSSLFLFSSLLLLLHIHIYSCIAYGKPTITWGHQRSPQRFAALWKLGELRPEASPSAGGDVTVSVGLKEGKGLSASKPGAQGQSGVKGLKRGKWDDMWDYFGIILGLYWDYIWDYMGLYGIIWDYMYGIIWDVMGFNGIYSAK